jgi:hypothetical protein
MIFEYADFVKEGGVADLSYVDYSFNLMQALKMEQVVVKLCLLFFFQSQVCFV